MPAGNKKIPKEKGHPSRGKRLSPPRTIRGLNVNQESFCMLLGLPDEKGRWRLNQTEAYILSHNWNGTRHNATVEAHRLRAGKPAINARIDELRNYYFAELADRATIGLSNQIRRIEEAEQTYNRLQDLIESRAVAHAHVTGGHTGLVVITHKGKDAEVEEYAFDQAVLAEQRAIRQEIGRELGQITTKTDLTSGGKPLEVLSDDERAARIAAIFDAARERRT